VRAATPLGAVIAGPEKATTAADSRSDRRSGSCLRGSGPMDSVATIDV
jgi:hypothetical protein